jgi:hypothetical protein
MMTTYTAAAAFVLPVAVSAAALAPAFAAFIGAGRTATPAAVEHTTDLATGADRVWFRGISKATAVSYVPQSRGSTG